MATLRGSSTVGPLTVASGGTLAPGDGLGTLHTGSFALESGAHFVLELGQANSDALIVSGTVTLAGDAQFTLLPDFTALMGAKFFVILNDGTDPVSGAFSSTPTATLTDEAGHLYAINYADNADNGAVANDVSLTVIAVPEPSSIILLVSITLLASVRRFRSRHT